MTDDPFAGCLIIAGVLLGCLILLGLLAVGAFALFVYWGSHCCGVNIPDPTPIVRPGGP